MKKFLIPLGIILLIVAMYYGVLKFQDVFGEENSSATDQNSQQTTNQDPANQTDQEFFDSMLYSINEPASPWWVVNKTRPLPSGYIPNDLAVPDVKLRLGESQEQMQFSKQATADLKSMFEAAKLDNITLVFGSGYRSEALQRQFYNSYVAKDGQAAADTYSARPGTSEHQTGLSFDATNATQTCHLEICFYSQPEGAWLKENAHSYGFIIRYPDGKQAITGYQYEPWHMRWVGKELAAEMKKSGVSTLEEFFELPAAPDYL